MTATVGPEKPRHIDDRISHLRTPDLIEAFGRPTGATDLATLRSWVGERLRRPAWPLPEWAAATRDSSDASAVLSSAAPLLGTTDVTGTDRGRSRRYGFHYLGWLRAGVSAWLLTEDRRYLDGFERHLLRWQQQRDTVVGDWPGLDVIWYSLGTWARCHQLLPTLEVLTRSPLSDEAWSALVGTLIGGARWAYDEHDEFRHGNWQLASASELMHIGSVLPDLIEAPAWAQRGHERLIEHLLLDVYPDGGHYERSPGYHTMCLDAVQTAMIIDHRNGAGWTTDPDLAARIRAMHSWLVALADPTGWVPHLQDSGLVWAGRYLLRGGYLLDDPTMISTARAWMDADDFAVQAGQLPPWTDGDRQRRWQRAVDSAAGEQSGRSGIADRPLSQLLPESGYAIARTGASLADLQLVINFGPHIEHELESHSHRAVLDFVLSASGEPLLWEAGGPPSYDVAEYLDWFQSGRGHNTVTVDDVECAVDRNARCERFIDTPALPVEVGTSTADAGPSAGRVTVFTGRHHGNGPLQRRTFLLVRDNPGYLVLFDEAEPDDRPHHFDFRLQSLAPWQQIGAESLQFESVGHRQGPNTQGQGLFVTELGDPRSTTVGQYTGTARRPLLSTRSSDYAPLHSLVLGRDAGRSRTVLWPTADAADRPTVTGDGDVVILSLGDHVDRISANQWSRCTPGADQDDQDDQWEACGWDADRLIDRDGPMIISSHPTELSALRTAGRLTVVIDCTSRCRIELRGDWQQLRLNEIALPSTSVDGHTEVTLPYAGRWTISGDRHD